MALDGLRTHHLENMHERIGGVSMGRHELPRMMSWVSKSLVMDSILLHYQSKGHIPRE
jgi:hypothetical protein